jgi:hypothetical protein
VSINVAELRAEADRIRAEMTRSSRRLESLDSKLAMLDRQYVRVLFTGSTRQWVYRIRPGDQWSINEPGCVKQSGRTGLDEIVKVVGLGYDDPQGTDVAYSGKPLFKVRIEVAD